MITWSLAALALSSALLAYRAREAFYDDVPPNACTMTYMRPNYVAVPVEAFAHKYGLYRYVDGVVHETTFELPACSKSCVQPILFVPGNKGSYGQARSLGAQVGRESSPCCVHVYTIDFSEEPSAFSGRMLADQSDYIDLLEKIVGIYKEEANRAVIVAHSMGGIAARGAMLRRSYPPNATKALVTLSSPHAGPVLPIVDGALGTFYAFVDDNWDSSVAVVSLHGGKRDFMVGPTMARHRHRRVRTFFNVGMHIDHLAMLWCNELIKEVARFISLSEGGMLDDARKRFADDYDYDYDDKVSGWMRRTTAFVVAACASGCVLLAKSVRRVKKEIKDRDATKIRILR